jgi:hypothetical protein
MQRGRRASLVWRGSGGRIATPLRDYPSGTNMLALAGSPPDEGTAHGLARSPACRFANPFRRMLAAHQGSNPEGVGHGTRRPYGVRPGRNGSGAHGAPGKSVSNHASPSTTAADKPFVTDAEKPFAVGADKVSRGPLTS